MKGSSTFTLRIYDPNSVLSASVTRLCDCCQHAAHSALDDVVKLGSLAARSPVQGRPEAQPRPSVLRALQAPKVGHHLAAVELQC